MSNIIKINKKDFVQKFEPVRMITEFRHIKTISQAVQEDQNSLSVYQKELGLDCVLAVIELHLIALNQSVNVNLPLTKNQIKEIAIEIISEFYYLSVIEIAFVFRKAKRGEFGKLFGALNIVDVLTWFRTYSEERSQLFINKQLESRQNDHSMRSEDRRLWERHERVINKNKDQGIK